MKGEFQNIRMQESYREFYEHKNKEAQAAQSLAAAQVQQAHVSIQQRMFTTTFTVDEPRDLGKHGARGDVAAPEG